MKISLTILMVLLAGCTTNEHLSQRKNTAHAETVTITGKVASPGEYQWYPGMTVSNLIAEAGGTTILSVKIYIHTNSFVPWSYELKPRQRVYVEHPPVSPGGAFIMK